MASSEKSSKGKASIALISSEELGLIIANPPLAKYLFVVVGFSNISTTPGFNCSMDGT